MKLFVFTTLIERTKADGICRWTAEIHFAPPALDLFSLNEGPQPNIRPRTLLAIGQLPNRKRRTHPSGPTFAQGFPEDFAYCWCSRHSNIRPAPRLSPDCFPPVADKRFLQSHHVACRPARFSVKQPPRQGNFRNGSDSGPNPEI